MSFQDIEAGVSHPAHSPSSTSTPQDATFLLVQSSLSLQVFKMNANVLGILLKLVDQLGTGKDSAILRKPLCVRTTLYSRFNRLNYERHDLTETTRAMAKRGSEDLKKLFGLQSTLVCYTISQKHLVSQLCCSPIRKRPFRRPRMTSNCHSSHFNAHSRSARRDRGYWCRGVKLAVEDDQISYAPHLLSCSSR